MKGYLFKDEYNAVEIDLTYLKEFSNGDYDFEKDILESIIVDTDEMLGIFKYSIDNKDLQKINLHAHSLKSLMNIVGSKELHEYFYRIEQNNYTVWEIDSEHFKFQINSIENKWIVAKFKLLRILKNYAEERKVCC